MIVITHLHETSFVRRGTGHASLHVHSCVKSGDQAEVVGFGRG